MSEFDFFKRIEEFSNILNNAKVTNNQNVNLDFYLAIENIKAMFTDVKENKNHIYIVGNGGSSSIASHFSIDLLNKCDLASHTLFDASALTCLSNDFGYENVFSKHLQKCMCSKDILFAISSSGNSQNIINAVNHAKSVGAKVVTLSGFSSDNILRGLGDMNFWLDSVDYGMVEIGHSFILHNIADNSMLNR